VKINIELNEKELRTLVREYITSLAGDLCVNLDNIVIEVKSKQNYKSEWEKAEFRAIYSSLL
jgi:hypothetical protein